LTDTSGLLLCPRCSGRLQRRGDYLDCGGCEAAYSAAAHLVDFRRGLKAPGGQEPALEKTEGEGTGASWPEIVRDYVELAPNRLESLYECVSSGRTAWKLLLDLDPNKVVLEIGGGTGLATSHLARHVSAAMMTESCLRCALLARRRFELHNHDDDVAILLVDREGPLPVRDAMFDCVVLSGIHGWLSRQAGASECRVIGTDELKDIRRVLKPGGQLLWIADNRFGYPRAPRPGTIRPSGVARSYLGYRRLLRKTGFTKPAAFGLTGRPSHLDSVRHLTGGPELYQQESPRGWKNRLKAHRFLAPRYGFLVQNDGDRAAGILGRMLHEIGRSLAARGGDSGLTLRHIRVSRKDKAVLALSSGNADLLVRVGLSEAGLASNERNHQMLEFLGSREGVKRIVPRSILRGSVAGQAYFVETRVPGRPLGRVVGGTGFEAMRRRVESLMDDLNPGLGPAANETLVGTAFETEVSNPVNALRPLVDHPDRIAAIREYFEKRLHGLPLPFGVTHGDFSVSNIFVGEKGAINGLIDWEGGAERSLPILDAIHCVESHHRMLTGERVGRAIPRLARGDFADPAHGRFLYGWYEKMGIEPGAHDALVYLKWARHMAHLASFWLVYDRQGIEDFVTPVVESILSGRSSAL